MGNILKPKICFVGAGSIAPFHISAAKGVGFELSAICAKPNSIRAKKLFEKYNFNYYLENLEEIQKFKPDAVVILSNTQNLMRIYKQLHALSIPILIEKPVVESVYEFPENIDLDHKKTIVGYNRRFYSSIQFVKANLGDLNQVHSSWVISELSTYQESSISEKIRALRENSVHIFDLLLYLFGSVKNITVERDPIISKLTCISALVKFNSGATASLNVSFNIPNLYEAKIYVPCRVFNLKPIENLFEFSKIQVTEPINENGSREYKADGPVWKMDKVDSQFKPGFYRQYEELKRLIFEIPCNVGASLRDAKAALQFAEALLDREYKQYSD